MISLTIHDVPDEVHRALRVRAARSGRSAEAEVREILRSIVTPERPICLGDALAALGPKAGLTDQDVAAIDRLRAMPPAEPMKIE